MPARMSASSSTSKIVRGAAIRLPPCATGPARFNHSAAGAGAQWTGRPIECPDESTACRDSASACPPSGSRTRPPGSPGRTTATTGRASSPPFPGSTPRSSATCTPRRVRAYPRQRRRTANGAARRVLEQRSASIWSRIRFFHVPTDRVWTRDYGADLRDHRTRRTSLSDRLALQRLGQVPQLAAGQRRAPRRSVSRPAARPATAAGVANGTAGRPGRRQHRRQRRGAAADHGGMPAQRRAGSAIPA